MSGKTIQRRGLWKRRSSRLLQILNTMTHTNVEEICNRVIHSGALFEDEDFPANESSLFYSEASSRGIEWKRPQEIIEDPRLLVDDISRDDVVQGELGDCWFLSSCAAIAQQKRFMEKIIPRKQHLWQDDNYIGLLHFKFWRFGKWVDVVVDDRLPTRYNQLMFARSHDERELWVALLEKAYAKLHGSYEGLAGGQASDALVDMTGGLTERYDLKHPPANLYQQLVRNARYGSFITCSKMGDWRCSETADQNGLISGHAYTVTAVKRCRLLDGSVENLVRVRNPWGNEMEWNGDWSDNSRTWDYVSDEEKQLIGWKDSDDGEFWITYEDFCQHFNEITVCTTGPDFDGNGVADVVENQGDSYYSASMTGSWVKGLNAGGSRNNLKSFATNPQFVFTLTEPDEWEPEVDDIKTKGKCSVVIALMQEYRRRKQYLTTKYHQISFILYKTDNPNKRLPMDHFMYNYPAGKSGVYINYREVNKRFSLDPGSYVLIPSTFDAGCAASFLIRIFAEKNFQCHELPDAVSKSFL
ncbi:calpain-A-like [Ptychodera flava]|uniref:calpain-A-like n=1 Tax=Ptychodera flava TaxID=63121 RepID=UPI00396A2507